MSWLYLRELAADCSVADCSAGEPSAPSKSTPTAKRSCSRANRTASSILSRSGMTFEVSQSETTSAARLSARFGVSLIRSSSARACPVSLSAQLEKCAASTTNETCGSRHSESSAKCGQQIAGSRTRQVSSGGFWEFMPALRRLAMSPLVLPLLPPPAWVQDILDAAYGGGRGAGEFLPTLSRSTFDSNCGGANGRSGKIRHSTPSLLIQTVKDGYLPTLTRTAGAGPGNHCKGGKRSGELLLNGVLRNAAYLPTPKSRDWKGKSQRGDRAPLDALPNSIGGRPNPEWCEWFMGLPMQWTALQPLETRRFRQWRRLHGEYFAVGDTCDAAPA